jgi:hypothetical protein
MSLCCRSISGSMPWVSYRVCIIFPLLPFTAIWWQAWLFLPQAIIPWPFYPWRSVPLLAFTWIHQYSFQGKKCGHVHYWNSFAGFQFDYVFDWTILKYQQAQIATAPPRAVVSFSNVPLLSYPPNMHICVTVCRDNFDVLPLLQGHGAGPSGLAPALQNDRQPGN